MCIINDLENLFRVAGHSLYFGEPVTEAEHALQCAYLAQQEGAGEPLVAAALLHDVGHLLHGLGEDISARGIDAKHEQGGAAYLARHFPAAVVDPVRLHVAAKRYLASVEPGYLQLLSPASVQSLALQGGPMTIDEQQEFDREPHARAALSLRRWDDAAKDPQAVVPGFEHYRDLLRRVMHAC